jgi:hypothetical protein
VDKKLARFDREWLVKNIANLNSKKHHLLLATSS